MADSLLSEVDQALRAERAGALWRTYRTRLIAGAILIIVVVAGHSLWQHQRETKGGETMRALAAAQALLVDAKALEAAEAFSAIAASARGSIKTLALIWQARALVVAKKEPEAVAVLKTALADAKASGDVWTDIACIRLAGLDAASAEPCLAARGDSPLATTRAEWLIAQYWAKGENDKAIATLEALLASAADDTELGEKNRARWTQWLTTLNATSTKTPKATATHE